MDTTTTNQLTISQAMATVMEMAMETMDSMDIQVVDPKMTSNQLHRTTHQTTNTYHHNLMHLNHNHNHHDQTTNTFHHHKIKIVQTEMATEISIHNPDIDTKAERNYTVLSVPHHTTNHTFQSTDINQVRSNNDATTLLQATV